MDLIFKEYLFNKNILVFDENSKKENQFHVLFTLANLFGIKIEEGVSLVSFEMISLAAHVLGRKVPEPFYRGFPETVKDLTKEQLLFDQLYNYFINYWMGDFSQDRHSIFEKDFERVAFRENFEVKKFKVITEEKAYELIKESVDELLSSTRPLNEVQYEFVKKYVIMFDYDTSKAKGKNTIIKLLTQTKKVYLAKAFSLSDFIKVVDQLNFFNYGNKNIKKLNLKNQDRKFLTSLLDYMLKNCYCNIEDCYERKKIWSGILHHIHYVPKNELGVRFLAYMRGDDNESAYSAFEKAMLDENIKEACDILLERKGSSMLLRKLNYIVSRCKTEEDVEYVVSKIDSKNIILLIQLILQYESYSSSRRVFTFTSHNKLVTHEETPYERKRRKSKLSSTQIRLLNKALKNLLKEKLKGRLGKVYIDKNMKNIALPLSETASQGGYGVLPKGSRIKIEECKKIRVFTYWEKVHDIDLSAIGLNTRSMEEEFSWRSMYHKQDKSILFSGDKVDGYNGGSEYFDIDLEKFKKLHPKTRTLVFSNNVYSAFSFNECLCTAGYMTRDKSDSGEVFEPKTVKTSFKITAESRYCHLFALDLVKHELVWLNMALDSMLNVAAEQDITYLMKYLKITKTFNYYNFFKMMAAKVVKDPSEADVVVTDEEVDCKEDAVLIHSYDFDKVMALLNK